MQNKILNISREPVTHQKLIYRIKQKLKLGALQSSFISRPKILQYIRILSEQNQCIKSVLNPPSIGDEIQQLQKRCQYLKVQVNKKQIQQRNLVEQNSILDDQISFMQDQYIKNVKQVETLQKQICILKQENSISNSQSVDQVSSLMDKFFNYFQQQKDQAPQSSPQQNKQAKQILGVGDPSPKEEIKQKDNKQKDNKQKETKQVEIKQIEKKQQPVTNRIKQTKSNESKSPRTPRGSLKKKKSIQKKDNGKIYKFTYIGQQDL